MGEFAINWRRARLIALTLAACISCVSSGIVPSFMLLTLLLALMRVRCVR